MTPNPLPDRPDIPFSWTGPPDPLEHPELFEGVVIRRILAYLIDAAILLGVIGFMWILVVFTLGLLTPFATGLTPVIPLAHHPRLIGGRDSATLGMRMMGTEIRALTGERPDLAQAFLMTALFYATMALTGLLLVVALFNERGRCPHDWLSGTVTIRVHRD